jgi:hypothetical protein
LGIFSQQVAYFWPCRGTIAYLLPEIVQVVRCATNARAMSFLQFEPLHTVSGESVDWDFIVA